MWLFATAILFNLVALSATVAAAPSNYTAFSNTDITPCVSPCVRVGDCGYNFNVTCNVTQIAAFCDATCGCVAYNSNGWLKGCGNTSCGITFERSDGTTTFIKDAGVPQIPEGEINAVEDEHFPPEEPAEAAAVVVPALLAADFGTQSALLRLAGTTTNVSAGGAAFNFTLRSVIHDGGSSVAALEIVFSRWGAFYFLNTTGVVARLRKGTGSTNFSMPNYNTITANDCLYYQRVEGVPLDYIKQRSLEHSNGFPSFTEAAAFLTPQREYASIGAIAPYTKFSVSPDGRIKRADSDIYTPTLAVNATGPGTLVFDPSRHAAWWPTTNWSFLKSALVGDDSLRVVSIIGFDVGSTRGFEMMVFAPASEPAASAYVRLRSTLGANSTTLSLQYFNISNVTAPAAPPPLLTPPAFYTAMLAEARWWRALYSDAMVYSIPGQEGARLSAAAWGGITSSLSLFIGDAPNYGDGADYWSPQTNRGGSLPFQTLAMNHALLDHGLLDAAADRVRYYFTHYITQGGQIDTGGWEPSCPDGFADGLADYGQLLDLFARTALAMVVQRDPGQAGDWMAVVYPHALSLANYTLRMRTAALANASHPVGDVAHGLIFGSPEHDTCHTPDFYYHNNAWIARGLIQLGVFLSACPQQFCPSSPISVLLAPAGTGLQADIAASLALSVSFNASSGLPFFIPPIARVKFTPFESMIESTLASYSNFRYYSELLGADILSSDLALALQEFRETHYGTVSGITRWTDHLDDMPSSYYAAQSLRSARLSSFWSLLFGHSANYASRGTFTATEQLPITPDAGGSNRDYLWSYLEGGIDQCVPSILLPTLATRWALVQERFDSPPPTANAHTSSSAISPASPMALDGSIYVAAGALNRWAFDDGAPGGGGGRFGVTGVRTKFGVLSFTSVNTNRIDGNGVDVALSLSMSPHPYIGPFLNGSSSPPVFVIRLVSANVEEDVLQEDTVKLAQVEGSSATITNIKVDAVAGGYATVRADGLPISFVLHASFFH